VSIANARRGYYQDSGKSLQWKCRKTPAITSFCVLSNSPTEPTRNLAGLLRPLAEVTVGFLRPIPHPKD